MNSVLQILFSLEDFQERYFKQGNAHLENCNRYAPDCFICQFSKIGNGLCSGDYSIKKEEKVIEGDKEKIEVYNIFLKDFGLNKILKFYQDGLKIHNFKTLVGKDHPEFSSNRQQDAMEYLQFLFSYLQKIEKQNNFQDITKIFSFIQATKLNCMDCGGVKIRENSSTELKLNCPYIKQEKPEDESGFEKESQQKSDFNYYEILGASRDDTQEEIKQKYKELSLKFHPDKAKSALSENMMKQINEAYAVLRDIDKRRQYDAKLDSA